MAKTALVIGASGLTGKYLLEYLLADSRYSQVHIFVRRSTGIKNEKLKEYIIDFDKTDSWSHLVKGDDLFCTLGTTIKVAGSQEAFRKVDLEYPVIFAKTGKVNGVKHFLLQSSVGANPNSGNFYLRTKGECEEKIKALGYEIFSVFHPSMLLGPRTEFRLGEIIGKIVMKGLFFLFSGPLKKYRAVHAKDVALAMRNAALENRKGIYFYQGDSLFRMASKKQEPF